LRLLQWWWWRFKSYVMLHSVNWYVVTNVLQALFSSKTLASTYWMTWHISEN
jgi:hypothetical protein